MTTLPQITAILILNIMLLAAVATAANTAIQSLEAGMNPAFWSLQMAV